MACASHAAHTLLSPLALAIDSRDASACWLLLREGVLRDHPEALLALHDACATTKLQPFQQLLSWVRKAKDTGTTNCLRPKAALATATSKEQWSPARREAGCTGQALLACCRVVAASDEIQDCIEEAPDTLTATTTPRFLERAFGIAQRHVCRHCVLSDDQLSARSLQDAAARIRALMPVVAEESRERPAAALRALLAAATADAACAQTGSCKQCAALQTMSTAPVANEAPAARAAVAVRSEAKQSLNGGSRRPSPLVPAPKPAATNGDEPPPKPAPAVVREPAVPAASASSPSAPAERVAGEKQPCRPVAKGVSGPVSSGTPPSKKPAPSSKKPIAAGKKPAQAVKRPALKQIEGQQSLKAFFAPK